MTDRAAPLMKARRNGLSIRYVKALRAHLDGRRAVNGAGASGLGHAAVAGGMAALDLAIIHEKAIVSLTPSHQFSNVRNGAIKRAGVFFTQALKPIEAAQEATRFANWRLKQHNELLHLNAEGLARVNRRLEAEVRRRRNAEAVVRKGKDEYQKLFLQSQVMQKKLRELTRQVIFAQEEERLEISRELHDEVVQTLVGINVQLSNLAKGASIGVRTLKAKIARTQRLVENSVDAVHRFARELRPAALDDLGLIPALQAYNKTLAARRKLKIKMTAFGAVEALGSAKRTVLYRVAQEALTNVARHAQATVVRLSLRQVSGSIRMVISDNGKSFDVQKTLLANNHRRLGLIGMKERIEMVGGNLNIASTPGKGTTVSAEVPFNSEEPKL